MSERKIEKFEQKSPETHAAVEEPSQEDQVGENLFDREAFDPYPLRFGLGEIPRRRLVPTPERCFMCGRDILAGQRYVRQMMGPTHVECRPGQSNPARDR